MWAGNVDSGLFFSMITIMIYLERVVMRGQFPNVSIWPYED